MTFVLENGSPGHLKFSAQLLAVYKLTNVIVGTAFCGISLPNNVARS